MTLGVCVNPAAAVLSRGREKLETPRRPRLPAPHHAPQLSRRPRLEPESEVSPRKVRR